MKRILLSLVLLFAFSPLTPVQAGDDVLYIAVDHPEGYDRSLFKHWIDADKNGCDTRKEVLIVEAIVKPKVGKKCVLTGGKWLSSFDGKTHTKDSGLDVDHLVPLAEAWRSGAWAWTDKEREIYANFIEQEWMLNAVTASVNRSKSDRDIANWLPTKNVCEYLRGWVIVKAYFNLTVDAAEAKVIDKNYSTCGLGTVTKQSLVPTPTPSATPKPTPTLLPPTIVVAQLVGGYNVFFTDQLDDLSKSFLNNVSIEESTISSTSGFNRVAFGQTSPVTVSTGTSLTKRWVRALVYGNDGSYPKNQDGTPAYSNVETVTAKSADNSDGKPPEIPSVSVATPTPTPTPTPTATPTPSAQTLIVTPGAFCSPAGATGKSSKGVAYTCKTSPTDTKNRWRQ